MSTHEESFCFFKPFSYEGVSFLEDKEDIFEDWREKFFNTWKVSMHCTADRLT